MRRRNVLLSAAAAFLMAGAASAPAAAQPVAISTLPPGAINNVQAQVLAKVAQENSRLQMRVATFNAPAAIIGAAQHRQAEFAFTSNDEGGAAISGIDEYEGRPMSDLRVALTVFPFQVGILVRRDSDIKRVEDLRGKRYPIGWQGFRQGIPLSQAQLAAGGLTLDDVDGVPTANLLRAADDFKAGRLDATTFAPGAPKMAEVDAAVGIRFLSFDDSEAALKAMQDVRPQYHMKVVEPAPHLPGIVGPTNLMQYYIIVLTHKDVPEDTVRTFVEAIHGQDEALRNGHPSFGAFRSAGMAVQHAGMEYHPAAVGFYREIGIWPES